MKVVLRSMIKKTEDWFKLIGKRKFKNSQNLLDQNTNKFIPPKNLSELAQFVKIMAQTGEGTNACLELDCLPMLVHYYSPIPDIKDMEKRDIWNKISKMTGINFRQDEQIKFLMELGKLYGNECKWPLHKTSKPEQFFLNNNSFSYGCAAALHCMVRYSKPRKIIEIGSGNSSRVISAAISANILDNINTITEYTIIDPFPDESALKYLNNISSIYKHRVELIDPSFFDQLRENDILFIDSSHSVKTGSDVNFLILEILPNLAPGVIIHFHDIPMPFEYHKTYFTSTTFRMFWTESYLLQAFLVNNNEFEILLAMSFLMREKMEFFSTAFQEFNIIENWANSESFWIRKVVKI